MIETQTRAAAPPSESWELLNTGSAAEFVDALCADALRHPAVDHPYLRRMATGEVPDMGRAIRDYCHQYSIYCAEFPRYLEGVVGGLTSVRHREVVLENLREEQGFDPRNPDSVPHTELFRRFRRAAGVTDDFDAQTPPCTTALIWRDLFLQKCQSRQPGVGLGAIGIGTELVVSRIYRYLHAAVSEFTSMEPEDFLFLTLHMDCDDDHADQLKGISVELAQEVEHREALRFGALSALNLRAAFWDAMLARAVVE